MAESTASTHPRTARRRRPMWLATAASAALIISACAAEPDQTDPRAAGAPDGLEEFYTQDLSWEECDAENLPNGTSATADEQMQCTTVTVPVSYEDPTGESIELAVVASGDADDPSLLTNPGGPGQSGVDFVANGAQTLATPSVRDHFRIIGFDPRGVHRSEGVVCLTDEEFDEAREDPGSSADLAEEAGDQEQRDHDLQQHQEVMDQCQEETGELLGQIDTLSAARDMDILRAAFHEEDLHYVGFSYGTKLGLAYAEEFPDRVGRFVLDAVMDVSLPMEDITREQAGGFENALTDFAQWCADQGCAAGDTADDVVDTVATLFAEVAENPVETADGRTVTVGILVNGFITPMYDASGWPHLSEALTMALDDGDYSAFQYFADLQAGRGQDGSYEWISNYAHSTIHCLDYPMNPEMGWDGFAEELEETSPTFGPYFAGDDLFCDVLPFEASFEPWEPDPALPPMLLIGTTGDPATPVSWAESMHEALPNSSLIVYEGEGHGAYRPGISCVTEPADAFLITGELEAGRTEC